MENPPPYSTEPQGPSCPPPVNPGYLPHLQDPGQSQMSASQPTSEYPRQCTTEIPLQAAGGYPPEPSRGYAPPATSYTPPATGYPPPATGYPPPPAGYPPPQGQGYVQQPASSHVSSNNTTVVLTQPSVVATPVIPPVKDYMALSIFTCLCCCPIIGILAIIKSSEATNRYVAGDYTGALSSSQTAKNLSIAAIISGISLTGILMAVLVAATQ